VRRKEYKNFCKFRGPGGMRCVCCGYSPGESRKRALRSARRRMGQSVKKDVNQDMEETP
jgi:hypothetical protein